MAGRISLLTLVATDANNRVIGKLKVGRQVQTIGRAPSASLVLHSPGVSRTHATVYLVDEGVVIHDEGSANGVRINGKLITGPVLLDEDSEVRISGFTLRLYSRDVPGTPKPSTSVRRDEFSGDDEGPNFDTRLEAASDAGAALARKKLQLTGRGGPYDGVEFRIDKVLASVGREADNDVTLEHASVSRRHAQLRLSVSGDRLTVMDLRSANGTFVDGQRLKRAEAVVGSVVRFGDLAFKLSVRGDGRSRKPAKRAKRRRLTLTMVAALAVLGGLGAAAYLKYVGGKRTPPPTAADPLQKQVEEARRLLDDARRRASNRQWSETVALVDQVLRLDPLNNEARLLRRRALDEVAHKELFERALRTSRTGTRQGLNEARGLLTEIPAVSAYAAEARLRGKLIDERLAELYRVDGVSRCKARAYKRCYGLLCRFFELMPPSALVAGEDAARRLMKKVEKRLSGRKLPQRCQAKRYLRADGSGLETGQAAALAKRYPDAAVRNVVELYQQGRLDKALKRLAKLIKRTRSPGQREPLEAMRQQLLVVGSTYQEGFASHRARRVSRAEQSWSTLLGADRKLMPPEVDSFYRREVTRALGRLHYELGDEEFGLGRYPTAFGHWRRGKQVDPSNPEILNGLIQLEKVAERLVRQAERLVADGRQAEAIKKLSLALGITDKGRQSHDEAQTQLTQLRGSR